MSKPAKILLQTTVPFFADGWHIGRFGLLRDHLAGLKDGHGHPTFEVTARNRDSLGRPDSILSTIDKSDFTQLWLFAVDEGNGLTPEDCAAISRFRRAGGGLMVTRDHMDLGSSVCSLGGVGAAHHFHSKNPSADPAHRAIDDPYTSDILWPNFHSGANGDYQIVTPVEPLHPVLSDPDESDGVLRYLPAHPHEGDVSAPMNDPTARVIATGRSKVTGVVFNVAVAFEPSEAGGPAIAQSTFHHFTDCNWDTRLGAPSFVTEPMGEGVLRSAPAQRSIRRYATNLANWLAGRPVRPHETKKQHQDRALDEALKESFPASDPPAVD
ncbi:MAG TPA: hypothetical protein VFA91_03575 [Candidatus Polarisedimenticolia bacterium]|nr:hypothetical protein [Candidatus Polarisedimenticolia bacterium]